MTAQTIRNATVSDESSVIDVLVLAFSTDPGARWTWPDPDQFCQPDQIVCSDAAYWVA